MLHFIFPVANRYLKDVLAKGSRAPRKIIDHPNSKKAPRPMSAKAMKAALKAEKEKKKAAAKKVPAKKKAAARKKPAAKAAKPRKKVA